MLALMDLLLVGMTPTNNLSFGWMNVWELNPEVGSLWLNASVSFGGSLRLKASMIGCRQAVPLFIYTLAFALLTYSMVQNII
jgi:hypothetical protein